MSSVGGSSGGSFLMARIARFAGETNIQNVSSALDNVTQGINSTPGGISNIQSMIDAFAPVGDFARQQTTDLPAVQAFAEVTPPAEYLDGLKGQAIYAESSLVPLPEILANLEDPQFDAGKALLASSENLFGGEGILQNLAGRNGLLGSSLAGIKFGYVAPDDPGSQPVDRSIAAAPESPSSGIGDKAVIVVGGKTEDSAALETPYSALGNMPIFDKLRSAALDSPVSGIGDKAVIVVGGKPQDSAAPETPYSALGNMPIFDKLTSAAQESPASRISTFESLLRSLFDVNPFSDQGKRALSHFGNQLLALGNMESTVKNSAELYRQLSESGGAKLVE